MSSSPATPSHKKNGRSFPRFWLPLLCFLLIGGYSLFVAAYHLVYQDRLYPGLLFANQDVSGFNQTAFESRFPRWQEEKTKEIAKQLRFRIVDTEGTHNLNINTQDLVVGEAPNAWEQLYSVGRKPTDVFFYAPFLLQTKLVPETKLNLSLHLNKDLAKERLEKEAARFAQATKDAHWQIEDPLMPQPDSVIPLQPSLIIVPEERGFTYDVNEAVQNMEQTVHAQIAPFQVTLAKIEAQKPSITAATLQPLLANAQKWMNATPIALKDEEGHRWDIGSDSIVRWMQPQTDASGTRVTLLTKEAVNELEADTKPLWRDAKDGRLEMNENKLVSLDAPQDGWRLDATSTIFAIEQSLSKASSTADAVFTSVPGQLQGEAASRLGIHESLGSGHSTYPGSPANRRKNIALGADKVHGTLIGPGEEFSLLKTLGEIDGPHGWLPELVIKGDKTTPEFGGGLCQIGTTVFRGATNIGMPITARQNHSYRVSYYEPAGTDATIYSPAPDFKFKNDTPNWILITKRMGKDEVWFDFWGSRDGRSVYKSTPKIFNIVQPPPQKNIETTELPVGKTKCTEKAHAGASASFDYNVTYANGDLKKVTFNSYYRPWQAVCLVGVAQVGQTPGTQPENSGSSAAPIPLSPDQSTAVTP